MGNSYKINNRVFNNTRFDINRGNPRLPDGNGRNVSFGGAEAEVVYKVTNLSAFKKLIPTVSFLGSVVSATGYLVGSIALFYDSHKERGMKKEALGEKTDLQKTPENKVSFSSLEDKIVSSENNKAGEGGVKTITAVTKVGKIGMVCGRIGVGASALAGMSCGLVEGIPTMAVGEATNLASASIIETPIGTGLFGIGIASIFSGLALENTPKLKLNYFKLMAVEGFSEKAKLIRKNMTSTMKEIFNSVFEVAKNIYKPKFLKEAFLKGTPNSVIFKEAINKEGKASIIEKGLRHNRNYMMHAASFTLGLGGVGIILASLFNQKKAQKASLVVEEGGFVFDNLGMTRFGLDKFTTGSKSAGANFAIGGVINAVSQFMGLDNKEGRAMQWLGISLVFAGFGVDRGKFLKKTLANLKQRPELQDVVREWKLDLSKVFTDKNELKALQKEIKTAAVTNKKFIAIENAFRKNIKNEIIKNKKVSEYEFKDFDAVKNNLGQDVEKQLKRQIIKDTLINVRNEFNAKLTKKNRQEYKAFRLSKVNKAIEEPSGKEQRKTIADAVVNNIIKDDITDFNETKKVLTICTKKTFGSENPTPIPPKA